MSPDEKREYLRAVELVAAAKPCMWGVAWVGDCKKPGTEADGRCPEHSGKTCKGCGAPATRECYETIGPLVCGHHLCGECVHKDGWAFAHGRPS